MRKLILLSFAALSLTSCATIITGTKQRINFTSNPSAASILIDEVEVGKTPFSIKLRRNHEHHIMIKHEGYQTYETNLTRKFNYWFLGNIMIGGITGIIVDSATGAMYRLSTSDVHAEMASGLVFQSNGDDLYIGVAMNINPNWEKIGQMEVKEN